MPDDNSNARTQPDNDRNGSSGMTPRAQTRQRRGISDNVRMVLVIVIPSVLMTIQTIGVAYIAKTMPTQQQVAQIDEKQDVVHDLVNSVSEKLRAAESAEARAEGITQGEAAERARQEAEPKP